RPTASRTRRLVWTHRHEHPGTTPRRLRTIRQRNVFEPTVAHASACRVPTHGDTSHTTRIPPRRFKSIDFKLAVFSTPRAHAISSSKGSPYASPFHPTRPHRRQPRQLAPLYRTAHQRRQSALLPQCPHSWTHSRKR